MSQPVSGPQRPRLTPAAGTPAPVSVSAARAAPPPDVFVPPGASSEFNRVLQRYKTALMEYKANGRGEFRTQAETLRNWLDAKLQESQSQLTKNATTIQGFIQQYAGSTSDIERVRRQFQNVRERGPVLQDVYETDNKLFAAEVKTYNLTPVYSKSALIVGLAVVAFVVWRRT